MRVRAKRTVQGLVLVAVLCLVVIIWDTEENDLRIGAEVKEHHNTEDRPLINYLAKRSRPNFPHRYHDGRHIQGLSDGQYDSPAKIIEIKYSESNQSGVHDLDFQAPELNNKPNFNEPEQRLGVKTSIELAAVHDRVDRNHQLPGFNTTETVLASHARKTEISDVFIGVKTTKRYHSGRLDLLLDTWVTMALDQTYVFTDGDDPVYSDKFYGHLINTNCSSQHTRQALCCKMSMMYDIFLQSNKRWFCHVDDDNYVNIVQLLKLLRQYQHTEDVYLGKPSLNHPIEAIDRTNNMRRVSFWFGTGGAGFCLSRALALRMSPYASGGTFTSMCQRIRLPDDVTIGFIVEVLLKKKLTKVKEFNSHLEALWQIKKIELPNQVTLSYGNRNMKAKNVISLDKTLFPTAEDPTRLRSFHCMIFPGTGRCPEKVPPFLSPGDLQPQRKGPINLNTN